MSKKEVDVLYPDLRGELSPGCPARVKGIFRKAKLISVLIGSRSPDPSCMNRAAELVRQQRGPGITKQQRGGFALGIVITSTTWVDTVWPGRPVSVRYLPAAAPNGGILHYTVRTDGKLW